MTCFGSMVSTMNIHGWQIVQLVITLDDVYQAMVLDNPQCKTETAFIKHPYTIFYKHCFVAENVQTFTKSDIAYLRHPHTQNISKIL